MATFEKRGPYQWRAKIRRKGYPVQTKTFETKSDAEAWATETESEMRRGVFVSRAEAERTTLAEALDRYLEKHVPKLAHPDKEERRIKGLKKRKLAKYSLAAIRGKDVADFIKEREAEGVAANTIRLDLAAISRLFEVARSNWGMESLVNPVKIADKPKTSDQGRERRLEDGEEKRLLESCHDSFETLVRFALETAMRRSEISNLRWKHVDLAKRSLLLPRTKNSTVRTVPLSPAALDILRSLSRDIRGSVFRMAPDSITRAFSRAVRKAKIEDLTFHDLRHEAISRLFENTDLDAMEIAEISGHKTMQMLKRYSHLRTSRLADRLAGKRRAPVELNKQGVS